MSHFPPRSLFAATAVAAAAFFAVMAAAPVRAQTCINLEVRNVRPGHGMLMVAVYGDVAGFNKQPVVATQMQAGSDPTMTFPLCGVASGPIALTLYQDLNGNGKLDANAFGIPSEPWGASGTVKPMTAPTWESASVVPDGKAIVIVLSK